MVGIVGTRRPSEVGRQIAYLLGREVASVGGVVVSGGALGIDTAAHQGCLDDGGVTWVVLPSTIDRPLPSSNKPLFSRVVASGGALLSEFEEQPKGKYAFCTRNRIIAALCDALIVVEAFSKSGTFHTVKAARRLERPIFAAPWRWTDIGHSVFHQLLSEGALPLGTVKQLFAKLSIDPPGTMEQRILPTGDSLEAQIIRVLEKDAGLCIEELVSRLSSYPRPEIVACVMRLDMKMLVEQDVFGFLRLSPSIYPAKR